MTVHNFRLACPAATLWRDGKFCVECVGKTAWPFSSTTAAWPGVVHGCYRDSRLATLPIAAGTALHRWRGTYDLIDIVAPVSGLRAGSPAQRGLPDAAADPPAGRLSQSQRRSWSR